VSLVGIKGTKMMIESPAQWRLFSPRDFDQTLSRWQLSRGVSLGLWDLDDTQPAGHPPQNHIHERAIDTLRQTLTRLQAHVRALTFEHGTEQKVPRAHVYRPYRLTLDGTLVAAIVLRASEAFNLCEVDVFLTTELSGLERLDVTRAALLFAFSDAAQHAGSMAVQFTQACSPSGVPPHVRELAGRAGVTLKHADAGTLDPDEVRELYLRWTGLSEAAQASVRLLAQRGFFSIERICYLIALDLWPVSEVDMVLQCSPYPDLILGGGLDLADRHLSAHALAHARAAVMSGYLGRALRYLQPALASRDFVERRHYRAVDRRLIADQLSVIHGPFSEAVELAGWSPLDDDVLPIARGGAVASFLRPRPLEEIRVFLRQDIQSIQATRTIDSSLAALLVYPGDYRRLSSEERREADQFARQYGVWLAVCPETVAGLNAEVLRRQRLGRAIRL